MNDVRTVSDTKRTFYSLHTRPINSIYRRVVEELMVEMHLLSVNVDFRYDPIYALGIVTTFDRFMQGYRPEQDKASIFSALCRANGGEPEQYRYDAEQALAQVAGMTLENFWQTLKDLPQEGIWGQLRANAENPSFKYSRPYAIGLYTLLETVDGDALKDEKRFIDDLKQLCEPLRLQPEKVQKDLELYRSNLDKMAQAQAVLEDILKAERKRKEEREKAKDAVTTPPAEGA